MCIRDSNSACQSDDVVVPVPDDGNAMQRLFDSAPVVPVEFSDFSDDEVDVPLRDRTLAEGNEVEFKSSFWDTSKIQHDLDELIESVEPLECFLQRFWEDAQERLGIVVVCCHVLSLIHISEPTR